MNSGVKGRIPYARLPIPTIKTLLSMSDRDRRLFLALLTRADFKTGRCTMTRNDLAAMTASNASKVSSSTAALAQAGLLEVTRQGLRRPNIYRLTLPRFNPPDVTETALSEILDMTESATSKPPDVTETAPHDDAETVTQKINTSSSRQKNTSLTPEQVYKNYVVLVCSGAKDDAIRSIKKLLKSGMTTETLMECVKRYAGNGMSDDMEYRIRPHNFFGRAARYKDYMGPVAGEGTPTEHLSAFVRAQKAEEREHGRES